MANALPQQPYRSAGPSHFVEQAQICNRLENRAMFGIDVSYVDEDDSHFVVKAGSRRMGME